MIYHAFLYKPVLSITRMLGKTYFTQKIGVSAMKFELCCLRLIFDTMLFFPIAGKKLELATMEKSTRTRKSWGKVESKFL